MNIGNIGSEELREYLSEVALEIHKEGEHDLYRRTMIHFTNTEVPGLDVPIVVAEITICPHKDVIPRGEVLSFDARCYGDSCFVASIYLCE